MTDQAAGMDVLRVGSASLDSLRRLTARYGAQINFLDPAQVLPGSYWGESEAGLIANVLYVRSDTPLHSALHELCHFVCMSAARRAALDRDAGGDDAEENAVCYLQILLADELPEFGRARAITDMDAWGYTFRLGSARKWFEEDAVDACIWLKRNDVIDEHDRPTFRLRT